MKNFSYNSSRTKIIERKFISILLSLSWVHRIKKDLKLIKKKFKNNYLFGYY